MDRPRYYTPVLSGPEYLRRLFTDQHIPCRDVSNRVAAAEQPIEQPMSSRQEGIQGENPMEDDQQQPQPPETMASPQQANNDNKRPRTRATTKASPNKKHKRDEDDDDDDIDDTLDDGEGDDDMDDTQEDGEGDDDMDDTWEDGEGDPCPGCEQLYRTEDFWIACDFCDVWWCGKCTKMTAAKAKKTPTWKCVRCTGQHTTA